MANGIPSSPEAFQLHVVNALAELRTAQNNINENIEHLLKYCQKIDNDSIGRDKELDNRLDAAEDKITWFSGAATLLGAILGWLGINFFHKG